MKQDKIDLKALSECREDCERIYSLVSNVGIEKVEFNGENLSIDSEALLLLTIDDIGDVDLWWAGDNSYQCVPNQRQIQAILDKYIIGEGVCEYEKTNRSHRGDYVYKFKCGNEILTTKYIVEHFVYCPYCGKKMKVEER